MSISLRVSGITSPDNTWMQMKAVWDACEVAEVTIPQEVQRYFGYEVPLENQKTVELEDSEAVQKWGSPSEKGFVVDLSKIPNITHLKFFASY